MLVDGDVGFSVYHGSTRLLIGTRAGHKLPQSSHENGRTTLQYTTSTALYNRKILSFQSSAAVCDGTDPFSSPSRRVAVSSSKILGKKMQRNDACTKAKVDLLSRVNSSSSGALLLVRIVFFLIAKKGNALSHKPTIQFHGASQPKPRLFVHTTCRILNARTSQHDLLLVAWQLGFEFSNQASANASFSIACMHTQPSQLEDACRWLLLSSHHADRLVVGHGHDKHTRPATHSCQLLRISQIVSQRTVNVTPKTLGNLIIQ